MKMKGFVLSALGVLVFSLVLGFVLPAKGAILPPPPRSCYIYYVVEEGGTISGEATQRIPNGTFGSYVTAVANSGYVFDGWTDGMVEATRADSCSFGIARTFTATFRRLGIPNLFIPVGMGQGEHNRIVTMNERGFVGVADQGGINVFMYLGSQAEFEVMGSQSGNPERHEIQILNLDMNTKGIKVQFASDPQVFDMALGDSLKIDLDGDKIADISVKYQDLVINRVELTLTSADSTLISGEATCETCESEEIASKYVFERDLTLNMSGVDVKELQKFLNNNGFVLATEGPGSLGNETETFGSLTKQALIKFQLSKQIEPALGYFGPITRGIVNGLMK